ncbi:HEAT repeat domain-containing protein [Natrinema thermotolerans]|uniref:HEAT repeat domain-containing protein n=1 Tax=Natrinema thermotolerans TaxID=121872 RepID=A0AAF0T217_9EURY|nr:HEAT repeat domain-containing protein [Natrinema thermotolerans]QCC57519.1 HEAT repeat domain-containing protein [Natrinema thermotolerans]WMT08598.1 HEAT repeat domain-containing protein [Natrinema thermotolerans]
MTDYANRSARGRAPDDDEATLRNRLESDRERDRRRGALGLVDPAADGGLAPATIGALAERATGDSSEDVRQFAVEALGLAASSGDAEPAREAIRAALSDDHEWVRSEAVVAQSRAEPGNEEPLRTALEDDSGWVRRNAVIALSKTGAASQELLIERIKNDPHSGVREYAADYLREYADEIEDAVRILAAVLARDPEAFVRAKAATSLGDLGTDRAEAVLERHGLNDRSDDVRRSAKRALATARGVDPDQIDAGLEDGAAPGGGPGSRREQQGPGPSRGPAGSIDGLTQGQRDRR